MTRKEEIQLQLKLKVRELVADRNKNNREIFGKAADDSIKEAMLLSRLQSQWLLFGSFASIAFILNAMGDIKQFNGYIIWSLLSFSGAALLSWFSISEWANYYNYQSVYYNKFYTHELKESQSWEDDLYNTGGGTPKIFDGKAYKQDMNKSHGWARGLLTCSLVLFIIAMSIGLTNLDYAGELAPKVDPSSSKQLIIKTHGVVEPKTNIEETKVSQDDLANTTDIRSAEEDE